MADKRPRISPPSTRRDTSPAGASTGASTTSTAKRGYRIPTPGAAPGTSRQYRWMVRKRLAGLCSQCGKPRNRFAHHCDVCHEKQRQYKSLRARVYKPSATYTEGRRNHKTHKKPKGKGRYSL